MAADIDARGPRREGIRTDREGLAPEPRLVQNSPAITTRTTTTIPGVENGPNQGTLRLIASGGPPAIGAPAVSTMDMPPAAPSVDSVAMNERSAPS